MSASSVVTRFAPSPSGELHLGNARMALFNYLLARARAGRFVLRIEDTDSERTQERFVEALCTDLTWLGLQWDEGPLRQSERAGVRRQKSGALILRRSASQPSDQDPDEDRARGARRRRRRPQKIGAA